jgi:hypothetical protein
MSAMISILSLIFATGFSSITLISGAVGDSRVADRSDLRHGMLAHDDFVGGGRELLSSSAALPPSTASSLRVQRQKCIPQYRA